MDDLYTLLGKIKTENRRLTKTRVGILKALFEFKKPRELKDLKRWLKKNRIRVDRSTVYRQLGFLINKRFVNKFRLDSGRTYYELAGEHHHHLVCVRCKKIEDIELDNCLQNFAPVIVKQRGFKLLGHTYEFYGVCASCANKPAG